MKGGAGRRVKVKSSQWCGTFCPSPCCLPQLHEGAAHSTRLISTQHIFFFSSTFAASRWHQ